MKNKTWVPSYPLSAQRRLWSDCADAQAELSLRWAHSHFVGFVIRRLIWWQLSSLYKVWWRCLSLASRRPGWKSLTISFEHQHYAVFGVNMFDRFHFNWEVGQCLAQNHENGDGYLFNNHRRSWSLIYEKNTTNNIFFHRIFQPCI